MHLFMSHRKQIMAIPTVKRWPDDQVEPCFKPFDSPDGFRGADIQDFPGLAPAAKQHAGPAAGIDKSVSAAAQRVQMHIGGRRDGLPVIVMALPDLTASPTAYSSD